MSTSELTVDDVTARPPAGGVLARRGDPFALRLLRSELRLVFGRRRNLALLAALACVPVLIAVAIRLSDGRPRRGGGGGDGGGGPAFIGSITQNGLFVAFTALVVA